MSARLSFADCASLLREGLRALALWLIAHVAAMAPKRARRRATKLEFWAKRYVLVAAAARFATRAAAFPQRPRSRPRLRRDAPNRAWPVDPRFSGGVRMRAASPSSATRWLLRRLLPRLPAHNVRARFERVLDILFNIDLYIDRLMRRARAKHGDFIRVSPTAHAPIVLHANAPCARCARADSS